MASHILSASLAALHPHLTALGAPRSPQTHLAVDADDPATTCTPSHSKLQLGVSLFLCVGLVVSYAPQIVRIVKNRTSLGFSPWFLLLGATSSASTFLNVVSLQWGLVRCCTKIGFTSCFESLLGIVQVGLQWLLFNTILVLFLVYFPSDRKYEHSISLPVDDDDEDEDDDDEEEDDQGHDAEEGEGDDIEAAHGVVPGKRAPSRTAAQSNTRDGHLAAPGMSTNQLTMAPSVDMGAPSHGNEVYDEDEDEEEEEEEDDDDEEEEEVEDVYGSSSAFTRLVPTFWPVWKGQGGASGGGAPPPPRPPATAAAAASARPGPRAPTTKTGGGTPWLRKLVGMRSVGHNGQQQQQQQQQQRVAQADEATDTELDAAAAAAAAAASSSSSSSSSRSKSVTIQVPSPGQSDLTLTPAAATRGSSASHVVRPGESSSSAFSQLHDAGASALSAAFGFGAERRKRRPRRVRRRTAEWNTALGVGWATGIHFVFILLITLLLVSTLPPSSFPGPSEPPRSPWPGPVPPSPPPGRGGDARVASLLSQHQRPSHSGVSVVTPDNAVVVQPQLLGPSSRLLLSRWASFLGATATALAAAQYVPQIYYTASTRLVGSLSIPMMCLQVPGSVVFVYSLAQRPGVNATSLAAYVCTGVLQSVLLAMCVAWKLRQRRAGLDDYGQPLRRDDDAATA